MKNEFKAISYLIYDNAKILDVGCGDGELMKFLSENKTKSIRGLEISKQNVQKCIQKGLTVIEGNAENDLKQFPDSSFEYVILSQTLQAFLNPENVINELLSGSSLLAARGCKKSCRRLRFARVISPRVCTCACSCSNEQID